jgi:type I restriction enzyme S subunit
MGEVFAHDRIQNVRMDRVPLNGKERETSLLERGDLLFARQSLVLEGAGKCSIFLDDGEPVTFESHLIRARLDSTVADPLYFFYFFRSPAGRSAIRSIVEQVAAAGIRGRDLANLPVPQIPVRQQRAIAHILGTLDDKIELNRRMNETLEEMARAIFKSWFVNFDPVRAKAEGRDPGLPEHIADLFPDRFEDSELGEIPAGWTIEPLDQVAHFLNGLALQKYPQEGSEYLPAIKIAELRKGVTASSGRASTKIPAQYVVEDGDILFSWSGSLEVQLWTGGRGALNQHLFKVTSQRYPKWFYYYWIKHHLTRFRDIAADKATTMGHIKRHHLTDALTIVPPLPTLEAMSATMDPIVSKMVNANLEARTLAAIRDSLLPRLISGELRVPDAEQVIEGFK